MVLVLVTMVPLPWPALLLDNSQSVSSKHQRGQTTRCYSSLNIFFVLFFFRRPSGHGYFQREKRKFAHDGMKLINNTATRYSYGVLQIRQQLVQRTAEQHELFVWDLGLLISGGIADGLGLLHVGHLFSVSLMAPFTGLAACIGLCNELSTSSSVGVWKIMHETIMNILRIPRRRKTTS